MIKGMKFLSLKLFFVFALLLIPHFVSAAAGDLGGYAWSPNIGWISFSCTNGANTCGTTNYGVHKTSGGLLTGDEANSVPGYAWSSSIGWIQFGGLSGFPSGSGTNAVNAQIDGSGNLIGWARALSYGGGWDGWISLSGTSPNYGVTFLSNAFSGYAWGSDVVGWINFDSGGSNGVKIIDIVEPAEFTLGGDEAIFIKTLTIGSSDSEKKDVRVIPNQAFIDEGNSVEVTIIVAPSQSASTTYSYSFDGGISYYYSEEFSKILTKLPNDYVTGLSFRVRVVQKSGAPALSEQTITLRGRDVVSEVTVDKTFTLTPVTYDPKFQEI